MENKKQAAASSGNLSHDKLLSMCFTYTWNKYPQTRQLCFHVMNESKPVSPELLRRILVQFCTFCGFYAGSEKLSAFISRNLYDKEHQIRMAQNKAIGIVPGVLDLIVYWRGVMYGFDIKIGNDRLSERQRDFIVAVERNGGKCFEIRSFEEFCKIFDNIVNCTYASNEK